MINLLPWRHERKIKLRRRAIFAGCLFLLVLNIAVAGYYLLLMRQLDVALVRKTHITAKIDAFDKRYQKYFVLVRRNKMRKRSFVWLQNVKQQQLVLVRFVHFLLQGIKQQITPIGMIKKGQGIAVTVVAPLQFDLHGYVQSLRQQDYVKKLVVQKLPDHELYQACILVVDL